MFPKHGYFYLKCLKNGLVISVNRDNDVGSKLVAETKKTDDDSQLWTFEDGCLVSKYTSLVMDIEGGDLMPDSRVLQYGRKKTMAHNQRWGIRDGFVYTVADPRLVLVAEDTAESYVRINIKSEENDLQQWYLEPYQAEE
ncbi:hypothetical protein BD770DRAFT_400708 [Pilaira anomala]|nr:hypothetical protein BD770DRAFT_400708 [Pilaira anomala]